jgi:thiosulfate dehydrogenase [quinone] large subunit
LEQQPRSTEEGYRTERAAGEPYQMKRDTEARARMEGATEQDMMTRARAEGVPAPVSTATHAVFAATRMALGFIFLWAFLDKLFGFGRSTKSASAWINGGSPTKGFLGSVDGPFAGMFNNMAGKVWADWLFMLGLAGLGTALILGIGMIVAAVAGPLLMTLMWMASLPIATNPFIDDHVIYALVIVGLALSRMGEPYSLGPWWKQTALVKS